LNNKLLVTAGALDGSSGLILSIIMCRAMNRSFTNVLFGAFGKAQAGAGRGRAEGVEAGDGRGRRTAARAGPQRRHHSRIRDGCRAGGKHKVRELYDALTKRGVTVKFAIHPVAGRMPGHMNVLLAEANIPYSALVEMDEINPEMRRPTSRS